uniref:CULT domain-containing protein n=1 Tax=Meloidogyne floridensis TaxID=298350 RepID=A0A915NP66_9BILA
MTIQIIGRQRCSLNSPLMLHDIYMEDIAITICNPTDVRVLDEEVLSKQIIKFPERKLHKKAGQLAFCLGLRRFKRSQIDLIINQGMTVFSFWVASNIPMSLDSKLLLLEENSTDRRLRMEWRIISQMTRIVCLACHDFKCSINDVINLSVDANSAHFVNQGGFVHDLFTVGTIKNVDFQGEPSPEFCWFSGECGTHIGWRFTTSSKDLTPSQFFGISRRSFKLAYQKEEE